MHPPPLARISRCRPEDFGFVACTRGGVTMRRLISLSTVSLLFFLALACATGADPITGGDLDPPPGQPPPEQLPADNLPPVAQPVAVEVLYSSPLSGFDQPRRFAVRERAAWFELWAQMTANLAPSPDPPSVDFTRQTVLVAAMGNRSSGGYSIAIPDVGTEDSRLFAVVESMSPGLGCTTTQSLTAPVAAVSVSAVAATVEWIERQDTLDCT